MIIRSKDTSLSFEIDDYQYPEHKSQEKGTITTQTGSKLLFSILIRMKWKNTRIPEVIADKESLYISDFMEPYLKFAIASTDGKILFGMEFVYEANKTSWNSHKVSEVITKENAEEIAEELRSMLARFPQR